MTAYPLLGYRNTEFRFSNDDNSITREFYCAHTSKINDFLTILLGSPYLNKMPHKHPKYDTFYCYDVNVVPANNKSTQGSVYVETTADIQSLLDGEETNTGGWKITALYKPLGQDGNISAITDETFDFSAQTMSLIGNNYAQDPANGLHWEDGSLVTNNKTITKIIPKIELLQKRIYCREIPGENQLALIGSVNNGPYSIGQQNSNTIKNWPAETILLTGMPCIRKFRWDGKFVCEIQLKFAINTYRDVIDSGATDYVTWNRLFRITKDPPTWQKVKLGKSNLPMYPVRDFAPLKLMGNVTI